MPAGLFRLAFITLVQVSRYRGGGLSCRDCSEICFESRIRLRHLSCGVSFFSNKDFPNAKICLRYRTVILGHLDTRIGVIRLFQFEVADIVAGRTSDSLLTDRIGKNLIKRIAEQTAGHGTLFPYGDGWLWRSLRRHGSSEIIRAGFHEYALPCVLTCGHLSESIAWRVEPQGVLRARTVASKTPPQPPHRGSWHILLASAAARRFRLHRRL